MALEAGGLNLLFSGSDITFVNPHCKKENFPKQDKKETQFSEVNQITSQVIALSSFCNSQFQFNLFSWETNAVEPIATFNDYYTSKFNYLHLDNTSPPPRIA
ncbi:hypothetical protein ACFQ3R_08235 [Mesonia ostreae]|uniref:Uncharacterized protein n=1 Tax=Mesonia ostreae TaxID=861110 RepID=A0ABU2KF59_9FLAO|nr:hypothetical protein [Mesonia ostreae]MDT0293341.1 hypothetical protein [Mesonia ostreae]